MTLERDSRLGKYVIRARIGAGGMGAVYRAYDTVLKREVAIKTILADKATQREFLSRFRREALAISQLDDPHIVRLLDFVEGDPAQGDPPYMVMELLRGQDLYSIIRKGPMAIERAVDILLETCAAVGTCHRYGFVHRDLKATNIFVTEYNAVETAKVLDFGVAKVWGEAPVAEGGDPSEVTRKGIAVGTPEYLAPEILRGGPATPQSDQYALGIVLYAALTGGRRPFEAQKHGEFRDLHLLQAILKGDHVGPRAHREEIPEALEEVIERAMAHDPARRFPSVHTLGEALLKWASPRARLQWTGHFTRPPKPVAPPLTISVAPGTPVPAGAGTMQVPSRDLRDLFHNAGVSDTVEAPPAPAPAPASVPVPVTTSLTQEDQPLKQPSRRLPMILVGGGLAAALGMGVVFLKGGDHVAAQPPAPPPPVAAEAPAPPPPAPAPERPAAAAEATPVVAPVAAPEPTEKRTPARKSRVKRHSQPKVDENGIGIPTD